VRARRACSRIVRPLNFDVRRRVEVSGVERLRGVRAMKRGIENRVSSGRFGSGGRPRNVLSGAFESSALLGARPGVRSNAAALPVIEGTRRIAGAAEQAVAADGHA
jgi:hypothetical protein